MNTTIPPPSRPPLFADAPAAIRKRVPLFRIDAGWLFLIAGIAIIAATVIIPARHDLDVALWQRDRAAVIEKHRLERLEHYGAYIRAVETGDEPVIMSLAAVGLNKSPADRVPVNPRSEPAEMSASVYPHLEPAPAVLPGKPIINNRSSLLARWATNDRSRLWMLAAGVLCVLLGLLPPRTRQPMRPAA